MKAVLWSRNAVLAVVSVEATTLETDAGDEPTCPNGSVGSGPITQFCASALVAPNSVTAMAIPPTRAPIRVSWTGRVGASLTSLSMPRAIPNICTPHSDACVQAPCLTRPSYVHERYPMIPLGG